MSPRTSKQLETVREQSREKIIQAALSIFAQKGFHGSSIQEIAKEAGVAKGLIYNYFESKEALLEATINSIYAYGQAIMTQAASKTTAFDQLEYLVQISFDYIRTNYELIKLMTQVMLQIEQFPNLREQMLGQYQATLPAWIHLFEQIGFPNPKDEALMLSALFDGIGMNYLNLHNDEVLNEMELLIRRRYLDPYRPPVTD